MEGDVFYVYNSKARTLRSLDESEMAARTEQKENRKVSDTSILDIPEEKDPVEQADNLIQAYGVLAGFSVFTKTEKMMLEVIVGLRNHIRSELSY